MKTVKTLGLQSGLRNVDKILSGFQESNLIILAARPSMGKTSFCLNVVANAAIRHKAPVLFFSLEMTSTQLATRILCTEAGIDANKVRRNLILPDDDINLRDANSKLSDSPIFINDTPGISLIEIRSESRKAALEHDLSMIVIDYLQLMNGDVSSNCQGLKALAIELNVPIITVSRLSRQLEKRSDKRPVLLDFLDSEMIAHADVVMFLYRDEYYKKEKSEAKGLAELIVAKNRNGPVDTVTLAFSKEHAMFSDHTLIK